MGMRAVRAFPSMLVVLGVLALSAVPVGANSSSGSSGFTSTERKKLEKGEIVMRQQAERRGSLKLVGGTSWQVIDRAPSVVWRALHDPSRYGKLLPEIAEARLVNRKDGMYTVYLRHKAPGGAKPDYHVNVRFAQNKRDVLFQIDPNRTSSIRVAWGFLRIDPYADGKTLVSWGVMADLGSGLIAGLVRPTVHEWLLKVPMTMKRFLEGSGRTLYEGS